QEGQQWGAEHAPEIDPLIASDIQVIKDASAIRYGVDAIGGVVVVNPPALPETPGLVGHLQGIGQSNGRGGTISGSLQGGVNGKPGWGWRLQGTQKQLGDHQSANYSLTNTGVRETSFSGAAGYHHERGGVDVFASRFSTTIGILKGTSVGNLVDLSRVIGAELPDQTKPFSYSIGEPRQEVVHSLMRIRGHLVLPRMTWRIQYAWQQNARKEFDIRRGSLLKIPAIDLMLNTHTIDSEWQPKTGSTNKVLVGLNGMYQYNRNIPGTQRIPFIPDFITLTGGMYGVYRHTVKRLTWDLGARFDVRHYSVSGFDFRNTRYRQRMDFANISATAGLTWKTGDQSSLSTSLSSAWRPPHVAELFSLGTHQSAAAIEYGLFLDPITNEVRDAASVKFRNEQALKWVGSWKGDWKIMKAEITTYANYIFNYFWLKPGGVTRNTRGAYPYFRYAQSDALFTGADLELTIPVGARLSVIPRASIIRATDLTNEDFLSFIPANRADLKLHYEVPSKGNFRNLFLELKGSQVFRQNRSPRTITPTEFLIASAQGTDPLAGSTRNFDFLAAPEGYFLFQASAGCSIMGNRLRYDFRISGDNLFNAAFREYTNRFRYYADDLGRNIRLSIKITF
ncbi:MAG: TonB-dependent receptor domain-containing protein, partial [Bacteroidota bacterium]